MSSTRLFAVALLGLVAIASIPCIMNLHTRVGTFDLIEAVTQKYPHLLLGGPAVLRTEFTHFKPVDAFLNELIHFFWPVVSSAMPELSLFGVYMGGQLFACLALIMIESERKGNSGGLIALPAVWGTLWVAIPFGFVQPIHNLVHMLLSPLGKARGPVEVNAISVNPKRIVLLPLSLTLGYIIPSFALSLSSPQVLSYHTHQGLIAAWQFFAIWTTIFQFILSSLISDFQINRILATVATVHAKSATALRYTYNFVLTLTGFTHFLVLGVVLFHGLIQSYLPTTLNQLHPLLVFLPISPFSSEKVDTLEHGVLSLLQHDTYFAGVSSIIWTLYLYSCVKPQVTFVAMVAKALLLTVLFGPCGAAIAIIKERDEAVFTSAKADVSKKEG